MKNDEVLGEDKIYRLKLARMIVMGVLSFVALLGIFWGIQAIRNVAIGIGLILYFGLIGVLNR